MEIRPFRGWRYVPGSDRDISPYIAPPYDILSVKDKQDLLARSERNIVAVDMPHVPPKDLGPDHLYREAAERLRQWQTAGVLRQDATPAVYAYEQSFTWAGKSYCRRALLGGVRATPFGQDVIPHEHTFAGPKADRLRLTEYTKMQLSPIFGFYNDAEAAVTGILNRIAEADPVVRGTIRGVGEKLWLVSDAGTIGAIAAALRQTPVFIADGHHRYTTQMNYRDALAAKSGLGADHEANFVLFALVARTDPGLVILPTHRMIRGLKDGFTLAGLVRNSPQFAWQRQALVDQDLTDADGLLRRHGPSAMAFVEPGSSDLWIARLKDRDAMRRAAPDKIDAWRQLDVAILHSLMIDVNLQPWTTPETAIEYTPDGLTVASACRSGKAQLGVCLQGTPLPAVEEIATAGEVMPHKSTYFYPKLTTGMVLKPLE